MNDLQPSWPSPVKSPLADGIRVRVRPGVYDDFYREREGVVIGRDDWAYVPVKVLIDGDASTSWFKDAHLQAITLHKESSHV